MDINQESVELVPRHQSVVSELEKSKQENKYLKLLTEQLQKNTFIDRGQLFQKFAEQGLCRKHILSEIQKVEKERLEHEDSLITEIM